MMMNDDVDDCIGCYYAQQQQQPDDGDQQHDRQLRDNHVNFYLDQTGSRRAGHSTVSGFRLG